jgi:hypothetical protein
MDIKKEVVTGFHGPNDGGYIHLAIKESAKYLKRAQELFSQGHYPHSNAKEIPKDHPLRVAMEQMSKIDEQYAFYANTKPDPEYFSTYEPSEEDKHRWDKYEIK